MTLELLQIRSLLESTKTWIWERCIICKMCNSNTCQKNHSKAFLTSLQSVCCHYQLCFRAFKTNLCPSLWGATDWFVVSFNRAHIGLVKPACSHRWVNLCTLCWSYWRQWLGGNNTSQLSGTKYPQQSFRKKTLNQTAKDTVPKMNFHIKMLWVNVSKSLFLQYRQELL